MATLSRGAARGKWPHAGSTTGNTLTTVDDLANQVGAYTPIAIGTDGQPVISYYDNTAGALDCRLACSAACWWCRGT